MPINFSSKVFPRRKSSGNVLDDVQRPPSEGFRVMSQVEVENRKSIIALEKEKKGRSKVFGAKPRQGSFEDDANARNSSLYDNSSSSARFSSSSTLPSSSEKDPIDNMFAGKNPDSRSFSLRGAGRTFTFGGKSSKPEPQPPIPGLPSNMPNKSRDRSMTSTTYSSTILPPQVDTRIEHDSSEFSSGFDNLFDGLSNPREKPLPPGPFHRTESEPILALPPKAFTSNRFTSTPDIANPDRMRESDISPRSWDSHNSQENLMSSSLSNSPVEERAPQVPPHRQGFPRPPPEAMSPTSDHSESPNRQFPPSTNSYLNLPGRPARKPLSANNSSEVSPKHSFSSASSSSNQIDKSLPYAAYAAALSPSFTDEDASVTSDATPRASSRRDTVRDDDEFAAAAAAARSFTERPPANKVMNQTQFNSYRKQHEMRAPSVKSDSGSADSYNYDEEDEAERQKELAKLRRRQEATMSVYRQKMTKMTGEKPMQGPTAAAAGLPRVTIDGSLAQSLSLDEGPESLPISQNGASSERSTGEESPDEDTPLGILMAHGFPNQNRPPSNAMGPNQPMVPADRPVSADNPRASTMLGGGKGLPPFARGLPREIPNYYGDGLLNPPNRQSLAFGNSGGGSVYGGSVAGDVPRNQTLVNVIANEERSKAMRRGSPNTRNGFGPMMQSNQSMPNFQASPHVSGMGNTADVGGVNGMGMMGMGMPPPGIDPAMAQMMMNQQMLQQQLLQSQQAMAAMLQQQMSMNGMGGMSQPTTPMSTMGGPQNGYLSPGGYAPSTRPMSIAPSIAGNRTSTMLQPQSTFGFAQQPPMNGMGRPASAYNLNLNLPSSRQSILMGNQVGGPSPGYTPSIAPSERSTIGMASRYRSVTQIGDGSSVASGQLLQQNPPSMSAATESRGKPGRGKAFLSAFKRDKKHEDIEEEDWSDVAQRKSRLLNPERKTERELKELWPQDA